MAKDLPYYQFEVAEYLAGDVMCCSLEAQGLFAVIKCLYWQKECDLTINQVLKRHNKPDLIKELLEENCIKINDGGVITISFLDEQYEQLKARREKLSKAGRKGGKAENKATLKPGLSDDKATPKHKEEKRREEKREEEKRKDKTLMSEATASDVSDVNVDYFPIAQSYYKLFQKNSSLLRVTWNHLEKITADNFIDPIRLMLEADNRTRADMQDVWRFLQSDDFWMKNIQSSKKLREKFDQLITKARNGSTTNTYSRQTTAKQAPVGTKHTGF